MCCKQLVATHAYSLHAHVVCSLGGYLAACYGRFAARHGFENVQHLQLIVSVFACAYVRASVTVRFAALVTWFLGCVIVFYQLHFTKCSLF